MHVRWVALALVVLALCAGPAGGQQLEPAAWSEAGTLTVWVSLEDGGEVPDELSVGLLAPDGTLFSHLTSGSSQIVLPVPAGTYVFNLTYLGVEVPRALYGTTGPSPVGPDGTVLIATDGDISFGLVLAANFTEDADGNGRLDWWEAAGGLGLGTFETDQSDHEPPGPAYTAAVALGIGLLLVALAALNYSKIGRGRLLDHSTRQTIYDHIKARPGVHLRLIGSELNLPLGVLNHHLTKLEREELVRSRAEGQYRRYYPTCAPLPRPSPVTPAQAQFLAAVRDHPGSTAQDLSERLGHSLRAAYYQAEQLAGTGQLTVRKDGRARRYYPGPAA